nr:uncharacterized protein LOC131784304 [Pocillopora verrucosa]
MVVSTYILATEGLTQGEIYALVNRTEAQLDAKHLLFCVEYNGSQMITVHQIRWMSQPFMQTPGAEAPLTVEFIGPVGELCEEHIRITMEYREITQNMLLPILSRRQNH